MRVIGLTGFARSGKDTFADLLVEEYGFTKMAFADGVREVAERLNPWLSIGEEGGDDFRTYKDLLEDPGYEKAKESYSEFRGLLVDIGHGMRETLGEKVWVDLLLGRLDKHTSSQRVVIPDVRYLNEQIALDHSWHDEIVVRIDREGTGPANAEEARSLALVLADDFIWNPGDVQAYKTAIRELMERNGFEPSSGS